MTHFPWPAWTDSFFAASEFGEKYGGDDHLGHRAFSVLAVAASDGSDAMDPSNGGIHSDVAGVISALAMTYLPCTPLFTAWLGVLLSQLSLRLYEYER